VSEVLETIVELEKSELLEVVEEITVDSVSLI
jgi:hypothetical protein